MKQFLTLCLATAMLGASLNVDAKITLQEAMQMKAEGKGIKAPMKTLDRNAIKMLPSTSAKPASGFHKLMQEKAELKAPGKKAPGKVTAKGDNIYGFLYSSGDYDLPYGLYELENPGFSLMWEDETGPTTYGCGLQDGVVKRYDLLTFWGYVFGVYYVELDFETGEILTYLEQDLDTNDNFMLGATLDSDEGVLYGYGFYGNDIAFMSAPADDPFNYTEICAVDSDGVSICYNSDDHEIYIVTEDFKLAKVNKQTGEVTEVMALDVPDAAVYYTALCYDPASKLFYWNIFYTDYTSAIATIDVANQKLEILEESATGEEWISFITTDEELSSVKPAKPVAGEVDFYKNNLIGFVTFTLPSESTDGTPLTGELVYKTYLNGQIYSTGKAEAGSEVRANFAVDGNGMYTFAMSASNDGLEGQKGSVRAYIGNDNPLAPANVKLLSDDNGNYYAKWDAVGGEGAHGGYVDAKAITYNVALNGNAVTTTADTTCALDDIDANDELSAYTVTVVAECNGQFSSVASSNTEVIGAALALPVYIQPDPDQFGISTVLDANEDGSTWGLSTKNDEYAIYSNWNADNQMDDYYFLPAIKLDDPNKFYTFSMEVSINHENWPEEYVEVLLCNEPSLNGVTDVIIDEFSPEGVSFERAEAQFRIRQAGDYYIAIHCTSDADQYGIWARNFSVVDNNITLDSPAAVDDLDLEAGEEGALQATASFTLPEKNLRGQDLDADAQLEATVSCGSSSVTVSGKPGEEVSAIVTTEQGTNEVAVSVALGELNSPAAYEYVYTGVYAPSTPTNLTAERSADRLSLTLSWDAVTDSDEGGYVDPETIVYDIYLYDSYWGYWYLYDSEIAETTYTYTEADSQQYATIGVVARNAAGNNGYLAVAQDVVGPAYGLPIEEDWEAVSFLTEPWLTTTFDDYDAPYIGLYYTSTFGDYNTICLAAYGSAGSKGQLVSPYFTTKGCNEVVYTLEILGDYFLPKLTVLASAEDIDEKEIGTITQDEEGFHNVSVSLPAEFMNKEFVNLYLQYEFESGDEYLVIESLSISDGSRVVSLANQGVKIAGGKNVINVTGLNGENVTVADLNGRVVANAAKADKAASFQVEKGIYVVKAGDKKAKVVVK